MNETENNSNIAASLIRMARQQPEAAAVIMDRPGGRGRKVTYRELDEDSDQLARGLKAIGIGKGTRTALMLPPSPDFFALVFAIFKLGAILVAVDPGLGVRGLKQCLKNAEPAAFIGIAKAHLARILLRWDAEGLRHRIVTGAIGLPGLVSLNEIRRLGAGSSAPILEPAVADTHAAILFTSGSTGAPKGVLYTHGNFSAQIEALRREFGICPGEVDLATFPLFALFAPALGMTAVIPVMDFTRPGGVNPESILKPIERYGITNMFGSPALLDRVSRWADPRGIKFSGVRRVLSAGAPVHARIMERFRSLLAPGVQVYSAYGATESLPVSIIGSDAVQGETGNLTAEGKGVCVGRPVAGIEVRIIALTDVAIPVWRDDLALAPNIIGEIVVRGPQVTQGYYNNAAATALSKIYTAAGDWYHRMGDVGYLDEQGRLWFCGRKGQRVETGEQTLFTIPCEGVFNTHPEVKRTALVGVPAGAPIRRPALCVELEASARGRDLSAIRNELLTLGAKYSHTRSIREILFHDRFPVDIRHNAKIDRDRLSRWAERKLR
ncbi:MAG: peptide synthase [Gammaproteobacteria bacterium]|nr:MAG: peptide synthase [Gammaproteobacteria bacterium]